MKGGHGKNKLHREKHRKPEATESSPIQKQELNSLHFYYCSIYQLQ